MKHAASTLRGLFIGINSYEDPSIGSLRYASKDCADVTRFFNEEAGFEDAEAESAFDTSANRLRKLVSEAAGICAHLDSPCDVFVLGFFGHGVDFRGKSYLLPTDADPQRLEETAVSLKWIMDQLREVKAKRRILFVDACYSGTERATRSRAAKSFGIDLVSMDDKGWAVLASCSLDEVSYESDDLQQGVYAHFLLKGLRGGADLDKDGAISDDDLQSYLKRQVTLWTKKAGLTAQTPQLSKAGTGPLIIVDRRTLSAKEPPLLAVVGTKGGTGKSTFISVAAQLVADLGHDVAIIDFDLNTSGTTLGAADFLNAASEPPDTVLALFQDYARNFESTIEPPTLLDITPNYLVDRAKGRMLLLPARDTNNDHLAEQDLDQAANESEADRPELMEGFVQYLVRRIVMAHPTIRLALVDCGAGKHFLNSAALLKAHSRYVVTIPKETYFGEIASIKSGHRKRYPQDPLQDLHVVVNRVASAPDLAVAAALRPLALIPLDPQLENADADYDLGYGEFFLNVRDVLEATLGLRYRELIPDPKYVRLFPWWMEFTRRGLAKAKLDSVRFRLQTIGSYLSVALASAIVFGTVLLAYRSAKSGSYGPIFFVLLSTFFLVLTLYYANVRRRQISLLQRFRDLPETLGAEHLALMDELLKEPNKEALRWLHSELEESQKKKKEARRFPRAFDRNETRR